MEKDDVNAVDAETVSRIKERSLKLPEKDREAYVQSRLKKAKARTGEINVNISTENGTHGTILNGADGGIVYYYPISEKKKQLSGAEEGQTWLIHADMEVRGAAKTFNNLHGIVFSLMGEEYVMSLDQAMALLKRRYGLSGYNFQHVREVLEHYVSEEIEGGRVRDIQQSEYFLRDDKIVIDHASGDVAGILSTLREYHDMASHPAAFRGVMAWSLLAPLHHALKTRSEVGLQAPIVILSGESKTGKTPLAYIFEGQGYGQGQKDYVYGFNRVKSLYTLTVHLSETNLPCVVDDVPMRWIVENRDNLKTYMQMGVFADRGRPNVDEGLKEYLGVRSFIGTMNETYVLDADKALSNRIIVYNFGSEELKRVNREAYSQLMADLPKGFMLTLAKEVFGGIDISMILNQAKRFETAQQWISFGIERINELCRKSGVREFPDGIERADPQESYVMEILNAMIAEYNRMEAYENPAGSQYYGMLYMEEANGRIKVEFTASAFLKIASPMNVPYKTVSDMMNNVSEQQGKIWVMNNGKRYSRRLMHGYTPVSVFGISIPAAKEAEIEASNFL